MVLETDIERSGIDRIQAGRAAAYTRHQAILTVIRARL